MSETSGKKPRSQLRVSCLTGTLVILLAIVVLALILLRRPSSPLPKRLVCQENLKKLGVILIQYAHENGGLYPPGERWCDVLTTRFRGEVDFNDVLRCPEVETGPCNYAMNPYAEPNGAGDVVLLFESQPGWNQHGGPTLLTTVNHEGKGANVLFVDWSVNFIKAEEVIGLKWRDGAMPSSEAGDSQQENKEE